MREVVRQIPNIVTSMNLLSGSIGVIMCLEGNIEAAFLLMIAAAVFDFFDGMTARALGVSSDMGKELDSLADVISFGLLPALMLSETMLSAGNHGWIRFFPLLIAPFSAYRLAKFNLDSRQHDSFIGLATPSSAMICGSLASYVRMNPESWISVLCAGSWFIPLLSAILSYLLICEIPMFSMKFSKGKKTDRRTDILRAVFLISSAVAAAAVLIFRSSWPLAFLYAFGIYAILNIAAFIIDKIR